MRHSALEGQILAFMRQGQEYTTRQIVLGLGRECGSRQGYPVIKVLHRLVEEKKLRREGTEEYAGYCWVKVIPNEKRRAVT